MAASDDDEFGFSSDVEDAMLALVDEPVQTKRKRVDEAPQTVPSKRAKVYSETSELARKILKKNFGLDGFRLKQEAAIARLLEGGNAAVIFPTGGGKSLCYQVPAIAFSEQDAETGERGPTDGGITIVVSPLIALMKDQVDALKKLGIYAAAMDSSKKREEYLQMHRDLCNGLVKILYCAPERLNNEGFVASLKNVRGGVRLVAVDEAHCVSEWGHSFRPDYLKVARFVREIQAERVICLTATATPAVAKDVCKAFAIDDDGMFVTSMYRQNLRLLVRTTTDVQAKYPLLFEFLRKNPGPTVVYATLQRQSEELADDLRKQKFNAVHFHAGERAEYKTRVQEEFLQSDNMIVCATIAFGMGIDKPDIRNVVHFDIPSSIEGYSQQVGRAGRDGKPSNCLFFVCPEDFYLRDVFVYGDLPSIESIRRLLDEVCSSENVCKRPGDTIEVSHYTQGRDLDIRSTALGILYAQLELHFKLIRAITPKYSDYSFEANPKYYVANVRGSTPAAKAIFGEAKKKAKLHHIDIDAVTRSTGVPRHELVKKLNDWNDDDVIALRTSGLQHVYKIEKQLPATKAQRQVIADTLFAQMHKREQQDLERTKDVMDLVTGESCLSRGLAKYFGDDSEGLTTECGHCTWCETHERLTVTPRQPASEDKAAIRQILDAVPERDDPRFLARIAFGIKSPRITASKYDKKPFFASLGKYDFPALVRMFTAACSKSQSASGHSKGSIKSSTKIDNAFPRSRGSSKMFGKNGTRGWTE